MSRRGDQEVRLPEMVRPLSLSEAAARHHADSCFLEEPQAVQHVRLHSQSLQVAMRVKSVTQRADHADLRTMMHPFVLVIGFIHPEMNGKVQAAV